MASELDFVIPVYNEGENIIPVLDSLKRAIHARFRVLICYDDEGDDTLVAIRGYEPETFEIVRVKNRYHRGPHGAVLSGFDASAAPAVLMIPADDDYNAAAFQAMYDEFRRGSDIVCASRFIPGGGMENCPFIKSVLVRSAAFTLRHLAFLPTHDPTNGLRLFSRRVLSTIAIESTEGFTYSIELLVKAHRLGWKISEIPVRWFERKKGQSRFRVFRWMIPYLRWYFYAFETTYLRRKPETVPLKVQSLGA
jgi:glycosyltransferase involved in cell wall biosynthesis